ncbi:MAG TPA: carboxypeptidase-like regulatory domain-containing protein, partial [Crocinitomicaceae bacterium]|nr:carboxypeptidase-like regulatory domain-containing protein [Crocinitomicaceae bacterium]
MNYFLASLFTALSFLTFGQDSIVFSGTVSDKNSNEALDFAQISIIELNESTYSDNNGKFSIKIPKGDYHIKIQF